MSYILIIIKLIPELISLVREVIGLVKDASSWIDKKQKVAELTSAIQVARETKDTSKLEAIFSGAPANISTPNPK